jgi:hypothetical protein
MRNIIQCGIARPDVVYDRLLCSVLVCSVSQFPLQRLTVRLVLRTQHEPILDGID